VCKASCRHASPFLQYPRCRSPLFPHAAVQVKGHCWTARQEARRRSTIACMHAVDKTGDKND
jgi:hypothetical protein